MKPGARTMRTIDTFATESPEELSRQLSQFEQNVDDAIRAITDAGLPIFTPTNLKTKAYTAAIGEIVNVDTSAATVVVTLPVATPQNAGRVIAINRKSASNTLTVRSVSGLVNGAATLNLTAAVRLFFLASDGVGWGATA